MGHIGGRPVQQVELLTVLLCEFLPPHLQLRRGVETADLSTLCGRINKSERYTHGIDVCLEPDGSRLELMATVFLPRLKKESQRRAIWLAQLLGDAQPLRHSEPLGRRAGRDQTRLSLTRFRPRQGPDDRRAPPRTRPRHRRDEWEGQRLARSPPPFQPTRRRLFSAPWRRRRSHLRLITCTSLNWNHGRYRRLRLQQD